MSFKIKLIYKGSIAKLIDKKNESLIFNKIKKKISILLNEKVT